MSNERLIKVYVKLVKAGRRALDENENDIPVVPNTIIDEVREELENEEPAN